MVDEKYKAKIKTVDEVKKLIGPRPRDNKVVMCHGTFDVVHPGHIHHLMYARDKADVLIASLTTDVHIAKANLRPFVPEELRALNLAALDMVDYVIIDNEATPLKNLTVLQPDYFAKGYEYVEDGFHPKTQEEKDVLDGYGGEILFTPGDIIYSSSALIDEAPPDISVEKLVSLFSAEQLSFDDLRGILAQFAGTKVHVVGDTIIDGHTYTSMIGGQTKTPTISVRHERNRNFVGGAGIVSKHLCAAGAEVVLSTVLGDDDLKEFALNDLKEAGVDVRAVIDDTRPTTYKNVFLCDDHRLLKVDTLDNRSISDRVLAQLKDQVASVDSDSIVFSDFRHGIFNPGTVAGLIESIPAGAFRVADSQVASRWGNILDFRDFDLITPNEREARFSLGDQDTVVRPLATKLFVEAKCKNLIMKLGERGIIAYRHRDNPEDLRSFFIVDSFVDHVRDAIGAGDALLAYATLAHVCGATSVIAAVLGSIAAAIECEHEGNVPVTPKDIMGKIDNLEKRSQYYV